MNLSANIIDTQLKYNLNDTLYEIVVYRKYRDT